MTKRIVLCADDYGQASSISKAILNLIEQKRISATSCLVNLVDWEAHGSFLIPFADQVDIGLHFNLTLGTPLSKKYKENIGQSFMPLWLLLLKTHSRLLPIDPIVHELNAQIDRFKAITGFLPHYIDGHQHVHQFPIIREAVVKVFKNRLNHGQYIRLVQPQSRGFNSLLNFKSWVIRSSGSAELKLLLDREKIPHNTSFSGIYSFVNEEYRPLFQHFLEIIQDKGLIMCHPGLKPVDGFFDPIAKTRVREYEYLGSEAFLIDCKKNNIIIKRFRRI